ncbi:angiopoietin-like protein 8 [Rhinoderma darwinii]|uniref:angiopoietin-like protein 8 n=1 Tax=Rhinoderma darwinii TaxID=43563 RepID=UPI003F67DE1B
MNAVYASSLCQHPIPSAMLLLLLLVLPLSLGEEKKKQSLNEEFNVLVYGTLQLGQALRDTYGSTNDKLQRIVGRQGKLEKKIEKLQAEVSRARQESRRMGEEVEKLQREEHERRALSHRTGDGLRATQKDYTELQKRVHDLEKRVQSKEKRLPELKERINQQNLILQVITEESTRQKRQMIGQRERLRTILKQASAMGSS